MYNLNFESSLAAYILYCTILRASQKSSALYTSSEGLQCDCQGCVDLHSPYQPSEVSEYKTTHSHFSKERQRGQLKFTQESCNPWNNTRRIKNFRVFISSCFAIIFTQIYTRSNLKGLKVRGVHALRTSKALRIGAPPYKNIFLRPLS